LVEQRFALLTMVPLSVVLAPVAYSAADSSTSLINRLVKVARVGVVVTIAH
jgi:hypothetical protein